MGDGSRLNSAVRLLFVMMETPSNGWVIDLSGLETLVARLEPIALQTLVERGTGEKKLSGAYFKSVFPHPYPGCLSQPHNFDACCEGMYG